MVSEYLSFKHYEPSTADYLTSRSQNFAINRAFLRLMIDGGVETDKTWLDLPETMTFFNKCKRATHVGDNHPQYLADIQYEQKLKDFASLYLKNPNIKDENKFIDILHSKLTILYNNDAVTTLTDAYHFGVRETETDMLYNESLIKAVCEKVDFSKCIDLLTKKGADGKLTFKSEKEINATLFDNEIKKVVAGFGDISKTIAKEKNRIF